jgi:hypothetical protein
MARARSSISPSSPSRRRPHRGRVDPRQQWAQRALALLLAGLVVLGLLTWAMWEVLRWLQRHPTAATALWVSALVLGLLVAGAVLYWMFHLPPPGLRWRHPRRADLARYYDQRGALRELQEMDPLDFERYVGRLFELEGYQVEYTARTGDEGVDLRLRRTGRGWRRRSSELALVQCKRYAPEHSVGSPELQRFSGALRHELAYEGYVVTTSFFTPSAQEWARREGIHLVDGLALLHWRSRLLRRARLGVIVSPLP